LSDVKQLGFDASQTLLSEYFAPWKVGSVESWKKTTGLDGGDGKSIFQVKVGGCFSSSVTAVPWAGESSVMVGGAGSSAAAGEAADAGTIAATIRAMSIGARRTETSSSGGGRPAVL
jgi:hypothetical protein